MYAQLSCDYSVGTHWLASDEETAENADGSNRMVTDKSYSIRLSLQTVAVSCDFITVEKEPEKIISNCTPELAISKNSQYCSFIRVARGVKIY